jgi:hypothetical protein
MQVPEIGEAGYVEGVLSAGDKLSQPLDTVVSVQESPPWDEKPFSVCCDCLDLNALKTHRFF